MSKYKASDKVVVDIKDTYLSAYGIKCYGLNGIGDYSVERIDEKTEPLSTYTEPLESKIRRQAAEITRLLAENEKLKEEYNQAFNQGTEAAWELARKIVIQNGYSSHDLYEIFESNDLQLVLEEYTYPEAAAKVAEREKAKEEIKVGDIVKIREGNNNDLCVLCMSTDKKYYNAVDGYGAVYYMLTKEMITKTGRHIDIDSFLKQIGEENNE